MATGDLTQKKKKRGPESAAETLDQIEELGDRVGNWIAEHIAILVAAAVGVLLTAGGVGYWASRSTDIQRDASMALAAAHQGYLREMGASPGDVLATEPANPETGAAVRRKYIEAYAQVRADHPGSPEASVAGLEQGSLQKALGNPEVAVATWVEVLNEPEQPGALRGLLLVRLGAASEEAGDWPSAASYYEEAGNLASYPLANSALANAARSYATAGQDDRALAVYDQLVAASSRPVPPHVRSQFEELRARSAR